MRHVKLIELTCNGKLAGCWKYLFCLTIVASVNCETDVFHAPMPSKVDQLYNREASDPIQVKFNFQSEGVERITGFENVFVPYLDTGKPLHHTALNKNQLILS